MRATTPGLPRLRRLGLALAALTLLAPAAAIANGPFGPWMTLPGNSVSAGPGYGFIQIPHHEALNPNGPLTFEGAAEHALHYPDLPVADRQGLHRETYWIGVCGSTLRSYLRGGASANNAGTIPANVPVLLLHSRVTSAVVDD
jgi:hypothetical protein